jgi:hypothetical protein
MGSVVASKLKTGFMFSRPDFSLGKEIESWSRVF